MRLSVGQVVAGRFEVERVLGAGGTAIVYLVHDKQAAAEGRVVRHALKVLTISSQAIRDRMLREGDVQQKLDHPNVVRVTDVFDLEGSPGLLMEYIDGPSLEQALGRYRLTMGDAEILFLGILGGVAAAHAAGLVHRDLKPANILLARTPDGFVPKVTDFGLAKLTGASAEEGKAAIHQTRSGIAMGTPSYMAPEQIRDARSVDQRADVWSLGCLLYELVTRQRAFPGDEALAIYNAIVDCEYTPVRRLVPDVPERLEQAIHGAIRLELGDRIPNCEEFKEVLLGVRPWPLPEDTLSDLQRADPNATPLYPRREEGREPLPIAGRPPSARGPSRSRAPEPVPVPDPAAAPYEAEQATVLVPPRNVGASRGGEARMPRPSAGVSALEAPIERPAPPVSRHEPDAETVVQPVPFPDPARLDGTLAPHDSPVGDRAGVLLGGGLVAALLLGSAAVVGLLAVVALVAVLIQPPAPAPAARPTPVVVPPLPVPADPPLARDPEAPAPEPIPAPGTPPVPQPEGPQPEGPQPEGPQPAAPQPADPKPEPAQPAPAEPRPAEPKPPKPPDPKPPPKPAPPTPAPPGGRFVAHIETRPAGAQVLIGNRVGVGPFEVELPASRYPVIVTAEGRMVQKVIAVTDGANRWCFDVPADTMTEGGCP